MSGAAFTGAMKPKILVIGLDAATMDLIAPWAAAGHLPALAQVISEGTSARLLSTPNMHSASAWTSILTGLNPGRHGLFVFSDRDFSTGQQTFFKGGDRTGATIISHLACHQMTSGLLNVPMTFPAQCEAGGYVVSGLDAPSLNDKAFCPASLRAELFDRFPNYNFTPPGLGDLMSAGRINEAIRAWLNLIKTQTAAAEYLIDRHPVDFFMTVYTASDWAGHNLWKYSSIASRDKNKDQAERFSNALLAIYKALDEAIASLLARADEHTQVYIISDHGMGLHTGASYHLASWLEKNAYMRRRAGQPGARAAAIKAGKRAARRLLPVALREKIKSGIGADRVQSLQTAEKDSFYSSIEWEQTTAYTELGRHVININLAGRNAHGKVAATDYDRVCRQIIQDLERWKDDSGARVVERVARRDEVYAGPFVERASDLYVYWNPEADLGEPPLEVRARGFWWSGDHTPEGILICKGPGIRNAATLLAPSVYDLVPTIMHLAGLPIPDALDGRVLEELCAEEFTAATPVRVFAGGERDKGEQSNLSQSDERLIEEKLRGLGYM